jgi:hypothetical protein
MSLNGSASSRTTENTRGRPRIAQYSAIHHTCMRFNDQLQWSISSQRLGLDLVGITHTSLASQISWHCKGARLLDNDSRNCTVIYKCASDRTCSMGKAVYRRQHRRATALIPLLLHGDCEGR